MSSGRATRDIWSGDESEVLRGNSLGGGAGRVEQAQKSEKEVTGC